MADKPTAEKTLLVIVSIAALIFVSYLMFLASVFAFVAVPFLMLLAFGAFFAVRVPFSERVLFFLRGFFVTPLMFLGFFAPWRALMIIANLTSPAMLPALFPMIERGSFHIPVLETVFGICGAFLAVLFGFKSLSTHIKFIRVIENLPKSKAGSAAVGLAEFNGVARSVTNRQFVLEDRSGSIRVELPPSSPWNPSDFFPLPDKNDFRKVFFTRRRGGDLLDGDPVYVVGSVEIDRDAAPLSAGSDRLIVRPSSEKERKGLVKRLLFPEFEQHDITEDYRNIFIATDRPESAARNLLRRAMFTSFGMTALFLALSLSLILIDIKQDTGVRDKVLREIASLVLKLPNEVKPPRKPEFTTHALSGRTVAPPAVYLDFDNGVINMGFAKSAVPVLSEMPEERPMTWQEELYIKIFPVPLEIPEIFGRAMEFGGNRYIDVISSPLPLSSGSFSVEFWFMLKETGEGAQPGLQHLFSSDLFSLSIGDGGGEIVFHSPCFDRLGNIGRWTSHDLDISRVMPSGLTPGLWHHFSAVHSGDMLDVRINGRAYFSIPSQIDREGLHCAMVPTKVVRMRLGGGETGRDNFMGLIDEFYFYDK